MSTQDACHTTTPKSWPAVPIRCHRPSRKRFVVVRTCGDVTSKHHMARWIQGQDSWTEQCLSYQTQSCRHRDWNSSIGNEHVNNMRMSSRRFPPISVAGCSSTNLANSWPQHSSSKGLFKTAALTWPEKVLSGLRTQLRSGSMQASPADGAL